MRLAPCGTRCVHEVDPGVAGTQRYGDDREYLQPRGQREQKGDGRCHRRCAGVRKETYAKEKDSDRRTDCRKS